MKSALSVLTERIGQFATGASGFSFDPTWGEIAGRAGLLLVALRETVLSPGSDSSALLSHCVTTLEQAGTSEKIDAYYLTVLRASTSAKERHALGQSARIRRNAVSLLRSAQLANSPPGDNPAEPAVIRVWAGWLRRQNQAAAVMTVPIAGHYAGKGFLAELQLSPINASPPIAVEHAELALEPLGAQLIETVAAQAGMKAISFQWQIVVKDELEGQWAPLDGDSLGAALAVGVELMSRRLTYHPGCLLIGRVVEEHRIGRTGFEREKLVRARAGAFTRIGVALDSELSDSEIEQVKPLIVRRLRTLRDAVEFAVVRKPVPYL